MRRIAWVWLLRRLRFLSLSDRDILAHAGTISHQIAKDLAGTEYDRFHTNRLQLEANHADEEDFEQLARQVEDKGKGEKA